MTTSSLTTSMFTKSAFSYLERLQRCFNKENLEALVGDLKKAKPASAKGVYLKKMTLSTTMGPGISIDQGSLET